MKNTIFFLSLCVLTCLCFACGNEGKSDRPRGKLQVQETGDGIEVLGPDGKVLIKGNKKNASIMMKANDGNETTMDFSTDKLLPDFPSDVPVLPDSKVYRDIKVLPDNKAYRDTKAPLVNKAYRDIKVLPVNKVCKAPLDNKVYKVAMVFKVFKVQQAVLQVQQN